MFLDIECKENRKEICFLNEEIISRPGENRKNMQATLLLKTAMHNLISDLSKRTLFGWSYILSIMLFVVPNNIVFVITVVKLPQKDHRK